MPQAARSRWAEADVSANAVLGQLGHRWGLCDQSELCTSTGRFTRSGHIPVTGLQALTESAQLPASVKRPVDTVLTG
jgi:hypothetical protein